jgi:hypothetical protein
VIHLTYKLGQNGHIGLYTASFTLANIFIVGVHIYARNFLVWVGWFLRAMRVKRGTIGKDYDRLLAC